jgi:hypothetical protein
MKGNRTNHGSSRPKSLLTMCKRGHELSDDNVYVVPSNGNRLCRKCMTYRRIKQQYGLTPEQLDALIIKQDNRCATCLVEFVEGMVFCVDHDHSCCPRNTSCGRCVRGLLCDMCNRGLGLMRDNPATLMRAAQYLDSFKER